MTLVRRAVLPLRVVLVLGFVMLLVFQTLAMPGQFRHMAQEDPDQAWLRWPLTIVAIVVIGCVQVVIVCTWHLLTMVAEDRIFTTSSMRWVDTILVAMAFGWTLVAAVLAGMAPQFDDPGFPMLMTLVMLGTGACGLLMIVMRELLRQATGLRADLDGVI